MSILTQFLSPFTRIEKWIFCSVEVSVRILLGNESHYAHTEFIRTRVFVVGYIDMIMKMDLGTMDDSSYRLNFDPDRKNEIHHYIARKSILKLVKLQSLVAKCCKMRKI